MKQYNTTKIKELDLWKLYESGDKTSLPKLITSMDPIIQSNVNKYSGVPLPRMALESEARRLAVNAFDTYNPNKGAALGTHVTNHLKHLQRFVLQYQNVGKIPEHRGIAISRYHNVKDNLEQDLNRPPTILELSDTLGWALAEVERMESEMRQDLTIGTGKEETSSFFDTSFYTRDKAKETIRFIYYDPKIDSVKKKIIEYSIGIGTPILSTFEIANKLNITEAQVRKIKSELAEEVNKYEEYFN